MREREREKKRETEREGKRMRERMREILIPVKPITFLCSQCFVIQCQY